jgi:putative colanic acid biosynthesis acetyltransferase WcaF
LKPFLKILQFSPCYIVINKYDLKTIDQQFSDFSNKLLQNNMTVHRIDLSKYEHTFSLKNKIGRVIWNICYWLLFRPSGMGPFRLWRIMLLKIFGAEISWKANVYGSAKIWAPWNLKLAEYATLGRQVDCYNQGRIEIGANTTISQKAYLCASSHNINDPKNSLILMPITIEDQVWIAADAFIGPNVKVGQGAVVGARSAVFKYVEPWTVVGGNPAKFLNKREIKS